MKKIFFLTLALICLWYFSNAQSYFSKTYHYDAADSMFRKETIVPVVELLGTGYLAACQSWNSMNGDTRLMLIKIDYNGDTILTKSYYDTSWFPNPSTLSLTNDGNIFLGSGVASYATDTTLFLLMKLNQNADTIWTKRYSSGLKKSNHRKTDKTSDGGFILSGWTGNSSNQLPTYGYIIKTDSAGNVLWNKQYGDSTKFNVATCALQLGDGGYFVLMWSSGQNTYDRDIILIKTDSAGNELWQQTYGLSGFLENGEKIRKLIDGNYLIAGVKCLGPGINENGKAYLLKIDTAGNVIWEKYYGSYWGQDLYDFYELSDSSIVSGTFARTTFNPSLNAGMLLKTNYVGDSLWMQTYLYDTTVTSSNDYMWSFIPTSDSGFLLAGQTQFGLTGTQDGWLVKVDSMGCPYAGCIPVGISENILTDRKYNIFLFPNPTRSVCNIVLPFSVNHQPCELEIIDINGKVVIRDNFLPENTGFTFPLRTNKLNSGIYLVKVKGFNKEFTTKLLKQ